MAMTDPTTGNLKHDPIQKAHMSAERLAAECDRRQVFDLHAIRRQMTSPQQHKKNKKRPRSLGGAGNVNHVKERSWVPVRGVAVAATGEA